MQVNKNTNGLLKSKTWENSVQVTHTHFIRCSASREEVAVVVAMNRDVKDVGVIVEGLLGAVAMMNILRVEEENKSNWS